MRLGDQRYNQFSCYTLCEGVWVIKDTIDSRNILCVKKVWLIKDTTDSHITHCVKKVV